MNNLRVMDKLKTLPGPRYKRQGPGSGEEFRDKHLVDAFDRAVGAGEILVVDMDGAQFGYPTSFLEETFGGLARSRGTEIVQKHIEIRCTSEPMLVKEIAHYIEHGEKERTPPFE